MHVNFKHLNKKKNKKANFLTNRNNFVEKDQKAHLKKYQIVTSFTSFSCICCSIYTVIIFSVFPDYLIINEFDYAEI